LNDLIANDVVNAMTSIQLGLRLLFLHRAAQKMLLQLVLFAAFNVLVLTVVLEFTFALFVAWLLTNVS
jgi:hypothetical protein